MTYYRDGEEVELDDNLGLIGDDSYWPHAEPPDMFGMHLVPTGDEEIDGFDELMAEGYRECGEDAAEFADLVWPIINEDAE
ncbi:MAG: hypothetical protein WC322_04990 [Candidatus Paceibacterota bacterium]|jgi:hypothetical protein